MVSDDIRDALLPQRHPAATPGKYFTRFYAIRITMGYQKLKNYGVNAVF
jgi:hypothetical protein